LLPNLINKLDDVEKKIIKYMGETCDKVFFSDLTHEFNLDSPYLSYKLKKLINLGLVKKIKKGVYELRYKTPLCFLFDKKNVNTYIGMLGLKNERTDPEPKVAIDLLEREGIKIKHVFIFATKETVNDWESFLAKSNFKLEIVEMDDIKRIENMENKVRRLLEDLMHEKVVILDCTSLTKMATIAFYKTAQKFYAPLIYIYEQTEELIWIQGRDEIMDQINLK